MTGCVSSTVREWALVGAAAGAATGAGIGFAVSDESLAGSSSGPVMAGDSRLEPGTTILGGAIVGVLLGGVIGAMIGQQRHDPLQESLDERLADEEKAEEAAEEARAQGGDSLELDAAALGMDPEDLEMIESGE